MRAHPLHLDYWGSLVENNHHPPSAAATDNHKRIISMARSVELIDHVNNFNSMPKLVESSISVSFYASAVLNIDRHLATAHMNMVY